jgi:uncharacterized protein
LNQLAGYFQFLRIHFIPTASPENDMSLKPSTVLVKPAGADCNLDCGYCFYLDRAGVVRPGFQPEWGFTRLHGRKMSPDILRTMVRQVMQGGGDQLAFGWQGGEPLLMGVEFFRLAVDFQRQYGRTGQTVGNGLQTNGTLITDEWCALFTETAWLVGLSLDGPEHVHDRYRRCRNGDGTYRRVRKAAELLTQKKVEFNALSVVNEYSARFPEEIYRHHKDLGIRHMQFIPCVERDATDASKAAPFSVEANALGRFMIAIFDLWKADFREGLPTTQVRWFDSYFYSYVNMPPPECTLQKECGRYVVVEYDGDVYSCDFFVEPEWRLGNIMTDDLTQMLNCSRQREFGRRKAVLPLPCRACSWLSRCQGGCPKDRMRDPTDLGRNHFCEAFKAFFAHADKDFRNLADGWRKQQRAIAARRKDACPCGSGLRYKDCCGKTRAVRADPQRQEKKETSGQ